ncbi:MAG: putative bifunctional diguanylate cyclase/phosphodiesterase, partial [Acetobacteraceae bacterium]
QQAGHYPGASRLPKIEVARRVAAGIRPEANRSASFQAFRAGLGALLFVDLDNFKLLNDTSGHDIGDLLLIQIARRLESCVREHDTVARLGGDEFVVLLRHLGTDPAGAARQVQSVGERILAVLPQPCFLRERMFQATPSIGIVLFDGRDGGVESLLQRADIAMYQAKAEGRNALRFFDPSMQARLGARLALISDLRAACEREEFTLDLEAQSDLAGRHAGVEAKLAWRRADTGPVRPEIFLPLAEETGLSLPLSQWAMRRIFMLARELAGSGEHRSLDLALDLSPHRFRAPDFVREVEALLAETGAPAERLFFEISEHLTIEDPEAVAARMRALKRLGLRFVLDGFGTGFSSFARLRRLPIDRIKIDPTFVAEVDQSQPARLLVRAVVSLARGLGVAVIADGVAREGQIRILAEEGCDFFQGKLLGPVGLPLPRPTGFAERQAALAGAPAAVANPLFG